MGSEFKIVRPKPIFTQIIEQIKNQILDGTLTPGDQLPSERQFSEMMGVNRHTVREALKVLEYMGVVQSKMGVGTIINNLGQDILVDRIVYAEQFSPRVFLFELMELRNILEPGIAALAAKRATNEDLATMRQTMEDFEKEFKENKIGTRADERLHVALAAATHNSTLVRLTEPIVSMLSQFREKSLKIKNRRQETFKEHGRIYLAIKNRNPEKARAAMSDHLAMVEQVLGISEGDNHGS